MSQWITTPDGRLFNLENARTVVQNGKSLMIQFSDGDVERIDYADTTSAATALANFSAFLNTGALVLASITPNNAPNGTSTASVLLGSGFTKDFTAGVFGGALTIGAVNIVSTGTIVFVNDNTILIRWTAGAPGAVTVTYTSVAGQSVMLTNGYANE